ncbi:uncharacterized protein L201_005395 [Kwoniella dendrophila CBS 6074]|uniref:Uncharacterized protein n=1 Tax=Kwoniella dendrophila CBS 6074 TaxID=1295534 RepID=A0AAX4JYJ2_9TREE
MSTAVSLPISSTNQTNNESSTTKPPSPPGPLPSPPTVIDFSSNPAEEPSVARRPTLRFPSLHLASFDNLSVPNSPQSFSPTGSSHHSNASATSPLRREFGEISGEPISSSGRVGNQVGGEDQNREASNKLGIEPTRSSSHSSRSSSHRLHKGPIPPPLPPPTMALPPLPTISPISPIGPPSPSYSSKGIQSTMFQPRSSSSSSSSLAHQQQQLGGGEGRRELPIVPSRGRSLGHSLTIHVPGPLTPSPTDQEGNPLPSPILKHSPGIARRRTVIENSNLNLGSPVKVSGITGNLTPPRDSSPTKDNKSPPIERGSILMPQPRPSPALEQNPVLETPRRLEKKRSSADLKNTSPTSPTTRRSLPRPPRLDITSSSKPSNADLNHAENIPTTSHAQTTAPTDAAVAPHSTAPSSAAPAKFIANLALPATAPVPSSSWPPLNIARSPVTAKFPALPAESSAGKPTVYQKHQANKSASSLPVVAGLADAGPYGGAFTRQAPAGPSGLGLGRPSNQVPSGQPIRGPSGKPQEEICLECMMRDRDLADVCVQGEGVWERSSDGDWRDLAEKEDYILKTIGNLDDHTSIYHELSKAADQSSEESDSTSFSLRSTGNSAEDAQIRRNLDTRKKRTSIIKSKKREADWRIAREVGWRGHKWEEGDAGEGFPRGFRGTKGGKLTEEGIKAVMTKFPSASAHRYQTLQTYLRQQWHLVQEVRAEAQRLGRFPFPDDIVASSSTVSSHEGQSIPRGAQPSVLAWDKQYGREINDSMRGINTPARGTPTLSVVRPSPSSPANLTGLANPPKSAPLPRPLTHFLPDREPSPGGARTPLYASPASASARGRHNKQGSSPGLLEHGPPVNGAYEESNEELWSPGDESGAAVRPFSFAVRAGAGASAGSDGHGGRKSLWGKFGGSVTSLFGGSQNGSGSMMDMHLGLDTDRRSRTSSYNVNPYPRAVSMASPTRPSFFSRDSRYDSEDNVAMPRMSRAISQSRLSQMKLDDDGNEEEDKPKKKGIKGFFKKMKPKGGRTKSKSDLLARPEDEYRNEQYQNNQSHSQPDTPLAPPPPLSYLVGSRKHHNRNRSGSSSSMLTDGQESIQDRRYSGSLPYNNTRSVSAPMNGINGPASSSGGSLSASPTSSKFATSGPGNRGSYASNSRRRSVGINELGQQQYMDQNDRRNSGMEMLSNPGSKAGGGIYSSPENSTTIYDEPSSIYRPNNNNYQNPNANFRPHNKTTSSLSNSSGTMAIETPPPAIYNPSSFFNQQQQTILPNNSNIDSTNNKPNTGPVVRSSSGQLSPNRFKNLPPLPPPGQEQVINASPDSFSAAFPPPSDQEFNLTGTVQDPKYLQKGMIDFSTPVAGSPNSIRYQSSPRNQIQFNSYPQPPPPKLNVNTHNIHQQQAYNRQPNNQQQYDSLHARAIANGRASFDQPSPRAKLGNTNERIVKTMYSQPPIMNDMNMNMNMGMGIPDQSGYTKEENKKKKGFKGFFGVSKAGRIA